MIWLQLTAEAEPLMGLAVTPLFTIPAAMGLLTVLPMLRWRRSQAWLCGGLAFLLAIAAGFVPAYDAQHPQRLNFRYAQVRRPRALAGRSGPAPSGGRAPAMAFSARPDPVSGDPDRKAYVAPAGAPRFAAPSASVMRNGRDVAVSLEGSAAAAGMVLTVPAAAGLTEVTLDGKTFPVAGPQRRLLISCASPGCRSATLC